VQTSGGRQATGSRARSWPVVVTLLLLAAVSLLDNTLAPDLYLLWACVALVGLALLAWGDGLHRRDVGLWPVTRRAAVASGVVVVVTAAAMVLGTRIPGVSTAFLDERVSGMGPGEVALAAVVRVPVGTALLEEVAFRGVLLAMLTRRFGVWRGVAGSSAAFGAWHLLPAVSVSAGNEAIGSALGANPVLLAGVGMAAAGLAGTFLCLLRLRYDHLIVPLALHTTANSLAYLLAWLMVSV
jgi:membrane protease YdiL (CAAX protease family)